MDNTQNIVNNLKGQIDYFTSKKEICTNELAIHDYTIKIKTLYDLIEKVNRGWC